MGMGSVPGGCWVVSALSLALAGRVQGPAPSCTPAARRQTERALVGVTGSQQPCLLVRAHRSHSHPHGTRLQFLSSIRPVYLSVGLFVGTYETLVEV